MPTQIAIAVVEHEGKYLIGLRPQGVPLAGMWGFAGGKLEAGESPADCARRECLEETGLDVVIGELYEAVPFDYPHGQLVIHFLHATPLEPHSAVPERFRWVSAAELADYEFPPANSGLLALLIGGAARSA